MKIAKLLTMICDNTCIETKSGDKITLIYDNMISILDADNDLCGFLETIDGKFIWKSFFNSSNDQKFETWDGFMKHALYSQLGAFTIGIGFVSSERITFDQIKFIFSRKTDAMTFFFNRKSLKCVYSSVDEEDDTQFVYIIHIKVENDCIVNFFDDPSTTKKSVAVTRKRKLVVA